jgi:hypothetical protein
MNRIRAFSLSALSMLVASCAGESMYSAYSEPYVVFESEHRMSTQGVVPAVVKAIDGVDIGSSQKTPVKPGMRRVDVNVAGMPDGSRSTVMVDAKPCMRYYLGAKRDAAGQMRAQVTGSEPIKECKAG